MPVGSFLLVAPDAPHLTTCAHFRSAVRSRVAAGSADVLALATAAGSAGVSSINRSSMSEQLSELESVESIDVIVSSMVCRLFTVDSTVCAME